MDLPPEAGIPIGMFANNQFSSLQVHYNNVQRRSGIRDDSGLRLKMTTELRQHNAGFLAVGRNPARPDGTAMRGGAQHRWSVTCNPAVLLPVTLWSHIEHQHLTGRRVTASIVREDGTTTIIADRNPYDFQKQELLGYDIRVQLRPGDKVQDCDLYSYGLHS